MAPNNKDYYGIGDLRSGYTTSAVHKTGDKRDHGLPNRVREAARNTASAASLRGRGAVECRGPRRAEAAAEAATGSPRRRASPVGGRAIDAETDDVPTWTKRTTRRRMEREM